MTENHKNIIRTLKLCYSIEGVLWYVRAICCHCSIYFFGLIKQKTFINHYHHHVLN